jgi:hypothetical protein
MNSEINTALSAKDAHRSNTSGNRTAVLGAMPKYSLITDDKKSGIISDMKRMPIYFEIRMIFEHCCDLYKI